MILNDHNLKYRNRTEFTAVSLFSNCGAGDVGYKKAGFEFQVMAELVRKRLDVCLLNHSRSVGVQGDLRETWKTVVETYRKKTDNAPLRLLAACPPCQGMSSARGLRGLHADADAGSKDSRNLLAVVIANVAKELWPEIIVVENVPEFFSKKVRHPQTQEPITASNLLIELLENEYKAFPVLIDMCDFNIPQSRKRSFLTFVRYKSPALKVILQESLIPFPPSDERNISIFKALKALKLPSLDAREEVLASSRLKGYEYHFVPTLNTQRYEMIAAIPIHSGKSAWENNKCKICKKINNEQDVRCSNCYTLLAKPIVKNGDDFRLIKGFKTSYKRMHSDKPAATILTASGTISSHNTVHPYENRVLSILECARLQTIDKYFKWGDTLEKWGPSIVREMIGEAVPPKFTKKHGDILMSLLIERPINMMQVSDKRHQSALLALRKSKVKK